MGFTTAAIVAEQRAELIKVTTGCKELDDILEGACLWCVCACVCVCVRACVCALAGAVSSRARRDLHADRHLRHDATSSLGRSPPPFPTNRRHRDGLAHRDVRGVQERQDAAVPHAVRDVPGERE
jgi:hypothetical protein